MKVTEVCTVKRVRALVQYVESIRDDFALAHAAEDDLWYEVLCAIAEGKAEDPQALAAEVIKTRDVDFARFCA